MAILRSVRPLVAGTGQDGESVLTAVVGEAELDCWSSARLQTAAMALALAEIALRVASAQYLADLYEGKLKKGRAAAANKGGFGSS